MFEFIIPTGNLHFYGVVCVYGMCVMVILVYKARSANSARQPGRPVWFACIGRLRFEMARSRPAEHLERLLTRPILRPRDNAFVEGVLIRSP